MYLSEDGIIILDGIFFFSPLLIKRKDIHVESLLNELFKYVNFN